MTVGFPKPNTPQSAIQTTRPNSKKTPPKKNHNPGVTKNGTDNQVVITNSENQYEIDAQGNKIYKSGNKVAAAVRATAPPPIDDDE